MRLNKLAPAFDGLVSSYACVSLSTSGQQLLSEHWKGKRRMFQEQEDKALAHWHTKTTYFVTDIIFNLVSKTL